MTVRASRGWWPAITLGGILLTVASDRAAGQWTSAVGVGGAVYSDARGTLQGSPLQATARLAFEGRRIALDAQGRWVGSNAGPEPAEAAGRVAARFQSPAVRGLSVLALPSLEATRLSRFERGGRLSLAAGVRWEHGPFEARALGGGSSLILGGIPERTVDFAFELRRRIASGGVAISSRGTRWQETQHADVDTVYFVAGFPFSGTTTRSVSAVRSYVDTEASAEWWFGFVQVHGRVGLRGFGESTVAARWAGVRLLVPVADRLAIVAETRRDPGTPEQRLRDRRVATLGLQMTSAALRRPRRGRSRSKEAAMHLSVDQESGGRRSLVIRGLPGRRVEITGTLTNWSPVQLTSDGRDAWRVTLPIEPGVHHLLVRVDGGDWRPPPPLPTVRHEFGTVGVLFVNAP